MQIDGAFDHTTFRSGRNILHMNWPQNVVCGSKLKKVFGTAILRLRSYVELTDVKEGSPISAGKDFKTFA